MAAALSGVGLWVLDCLDWWTSLLSVAHEVFTQARCAAGCPPSPSRLHSCFLVSVDALFGSRNRLDGSAVLPHCRSGACKGCRHSARCRARQRASPASSRGPPGARTLTAARGHPLRAFPGANSPPGLRSRMCCPANLRMESTLGSCTSPWVSSLRSCNQLSTRLPAALLQRHWAGDGGGACETRGAR